MTDLEIQTLALDEKLSITQAAPLLETLKALQGQAVQLDGGNVKHIDMPCAQVLVSAANHWAAAQTLFKITSPSKALSDSLALLGLDMSIKFQGELS